MPRTAARVQIVILEQHSLFSEGIAQLIRSAGKLQIVSLRAADPDAEARLKRLRPRVVIVESSRQDFDWRILRGLPPATVIRVSLDDNVADVYELYRGESRIRKAA